MGRQGRKSMALLITKGGEGKEGGRLTEPRGKRSKQEWFTGMGRESDEGRRGGERVPRVN